MSAITVLRPLNDDELAAMTFIELGRAFRHTLAAGASASEQSRRIRAELARRPDPETAVAVQERFDVV